MPDDALDAYAAIQARLEFLMDKYEPYRTVTRTLYPEGRPAMSTATCGEGLHFTITPGRRGHPGWFYPFSATQGEV